MRAPVERLVGVPLGGCEKRHALRYPDQATFHPLKYLAGLAEACGKNNVRFFSDTPVDEVIEKNGAVSVKSRRGAIRAGHAVIAIGVEQRLAGGDGELGDPELRA